MSKFTVTEHREVEVKVNKCVCGHHPDVKSRSIAGSYSDGYAFIQCKCGLKMKVETSNLLIDDSSPTLLSLAQTCASKWNRVMK